MKFHTKALAFLLCAATAAATVTTAMPVSAAEIQEEISDSESIMDVQVELPDSESIMDIQEELTDSNTVSDEYASSEREDSDNSEMEEPNVQENESEEETEEEPEVPEVPEEPEQILIMCPEQYHLTILEDGFIQLSYTDTSGRVTELTDCYVLLETTTESDTESNTITTTWQVIDPAKSAEYPDAIAYYFDRTGLGLPTTSTTIGNIFYQGTASDYYLSNGHICTDERITDVSGKMYLISDQGKPELYNGIYNNILYQKGVKVTGKTVLLNPTEKYGVTCYTLISTGVSAKYPNARIFTVNDSGIAAQYTGTGIINMFTGTQTANYYVKSGKIQAYGKTSLASVSGLMYLVSPTGIAKIYSGRHTNGYIYRNGKVWATGKKYFYCTGTSIYLVDTAGFSTKYVKSTTTSQNYYTISYSYDGKKYVYLCNTKTAAAKKVIKDAGKTGSYFLSISGKLYKVTYNTGEPTIFTGVYNGYYYSSGVKLTAKSTYYRVYNNYLYQISSSGAAKIYIKNAYSSATYTKLIGTYIYYVYNNTGKILKKITSAEARALYISAATSYLGTIEGTARHTEIIELYNSYTPHARGYTMTTKDSWCATFVSAMFVKSGLVSFAQMECSCGYQVDLWKRAGCWIENDAYVPKAGDLIYYAWNDSGVGDCTKWPNHVGIVVSVTNGKIKVLEGNMDLKRSDRKDGVGYRTIDVNGRYIRGFASPKY